MVRKRAKSSMNFIPLVYGFVSIIPVNHYVYVFVHQHMFIHHRWQFFSWLHLKLHGSPAFDCIQENQIFYEKREKKYFCVLSCLPYPTSFHIKYYANTWEKNFNQKVLFSFPLLAWIPLLILFTNLLIWHIK